MSNVDTDTGVEFVDGPMNGLQSRDLNEQKMNKMKTKSLQSSDCIGKYIELSSRIQKGQSALNYKLKL